ncbi:MAG: TadE/TadG family type IV pilus assembly protein [Novosphingobium sp.]
MMRPDRSFWRDPSGASAAEFALVLPLMLLFLFGIIDVGRYAWTLNQAEKAVQIGARMAVVTDIVAPGIAAANYIGLGTPALTQGDPIPVAAFGLAECTATSCRCVTAPCPTPNTGLGYNGAAFQAIASRMRQIEPTIGDANVVVEYRGSGLGFAGDPSGSDIAPLTTVRLADMDFAPITLLLFSANVPLPQVSHTLTMEDGSGTASN